MLYYLVGPEATADEPMSAAFREWVISEARGVDGTVGVVAECGSREYRVVRLQRVHPVPRAASRRAKR